MRKIWKWVIPFILILALAGVYLYPVPQPPVESIYAQVAPATYAGLAEFRSTHPVKTLVQDGETWEYLASGSGEQAVLLLHGMTGSHDIWWQQFIALEGQYRVVSVTYPPVDNLEGLSQGVIAILDQEGIGTVSVVGTSLGGYFAQYLATFYPERVDRVVLSNTFPPNDLIAENNRAIGAALPYLPEWLVMSVLRGSFETSVYSASGNDELTLAFLNEMGYGRMSKAQVVARYRCVVEKFETAPASIPVLIIESDNDPLVAMELRGQLKLAFPSAEVYTIQAAGHFPYLNRAGEYNPLLLDFLSAK